MFIKTQRYEYPQKHSRSEPFNSIDTIWIDRKTVRMVTEDPTRVVFNKDTKKTEQFLLPLSVNNYA